MCGEHGTQLKESLGSSIATMKNPFKHMRNWVKTELLDLQALMQAIQRKDGVENARQRCLKTIKSKRETIEKLNTGKFTLKGLFKNAGEKANEVQTLT